MKDPYEDPPAGASLAARAAMEYALGMLDGLEPPVIIGPLRLARLAKRLRGKRGGIRRTRVRRGSDDPRARLLESHGAMAAVLTALELSASSGQALTAEDLDALRVRLQNAIDGLPTYVGGTLRLPPL